MARERNKPSAEPGCTLAQGARAQRPKSAPTQTPRRRAPTVFLCSSGTGGGGIGHGLRTSR
eukprot:1587848-Alexandrium_andersonii.AAC.1